MTEKSRDYRACRVQLRREEGDAYVDVPCSSFEDLDISEGALLFTDKAGAWIACFAAGAWAYIDWVD